jgi:ketosteroid isomerase-like protein
MPNNTTPVLRGFLADHDRRWLAEDVELHDRTATEPRLGRAAASAWWSRLFDEVFSDARADATRVTVQGACASVEWSFRGRHVGSLAGERPSSRLVTVAMVGIFEIADGEIHRLDIYYDSLGLLRQLGVSVPAVSAA